MSEDQKQQLEKQLWGIANLLRGKISVVRQSVKKNGK